MLQLAQTNISNPLSGSQLRNYHVARQLAMIMDVTHLGFCDESEPVSAEYTNKPIRTMSIRRGRSYTLNKLVRGALGKTPATLLNSWSDAMAAALTTELESGRYDIVQLEGIEMSPYLDIIRNTRHRPKYVVLNWHNIESELAARHARHAQTPFHRLYLRRTVSQLRTIERDLLNRCNMHLVTSERERKVLLHQNVTANILLLENGVDSSTFVPDEANGANPSLSAKRDRLLFIGSMDYSANIDAVMYFVKEMWPAIQRDCPTFRFTIVGRNPTDEVRALAARASVEVTGTVSDVRPYYKEAFAAVVPLRVGGGTRLKVLEAMAAGVPVVATPVGVEGLRLRPGIHFKLADSPAAFQREICELRKEPLSWLKIAAAGRDLVAKTYDWRVVCAELIGTYCRLFRIELDSQNTQPHDGRLSERVKDFATDTVEAHAHSLSLARENYLEASQLRDDTWTSNRR